MRDDAIDAGEAGCAVTSRSLTILGIGNTLLTDEGVGVCVVEYLRPLLMGREGIVLIDGGTLGFELLAMLEDTEEFIVIDAAMLDAAPGAIRVLIGAEMDQYLGLPRRSAHEVGLRDLLDLARLDGRLPRRRALIAIQPERIDWGDALTFALQEAVPRAASLAIKVVDEWSGDLPGPRRD